MTYERMENDATVFNINTQCSLHKACVMVFALSQQTQFETSDYIDTFTHNNTV